MVSVAGPVAADGFIGPVFGLATAPNGDLLAADAAVGVVEYRDGKVTLNAPLPLIMDLAPIGRGSWWAVHGAEDGLQGTNLGQAVYRASRGSVRELVNLFEFETANNPAGGLIESNPFDVHSLSGERALVVDAAGNDLLRVDNEGHVEVLAVFPNEVVSSADLKALLGCPPVPPPSGLCSLPENVPAQPVPTSVAVGPDGYYYVGELKGIPAPQGESRIWRVAPWAYWATCPDVDCELVFDGGFTSIIDLAFGPDGLLYVVELDENSWFAANLPPAALAGGTISACDVEAPSCEEVAGGLALPTAITFGKDGRLWSTEFGAVPGMATVIEIP